LAAFPIESHSPLNLAPDSPKVFVDIRPAVELKIAQRVADQ
jgi:hypothetical protein